MKVTIFIGGLTTGGAERVVCNLSNYLIKNHEITVLTMSNDPSSYYLDPDIKRVSLYRKSENKNFINKNISRFIRFREYIKKDDSDIYVSFLPWTVLITLLNRNIIKKPIVISERGDPATLFNNSIIFKTALKKIYPKADGFVFQTEGAQQYYIDQINKEGIVIPNAINEDFLGKDESKTGTQKYIISVGRLTEQKNYNLLIDSFKSISKIYPEYELHIYGEGELKKELEKKVSQLKLENKVFFKGYVNNIKKYLSEASLFVMASNYEGLPNALMEAMALGLPVLSTDCPPGGPASLIEHKKNGYLVPMNNKEKMAEGIKEILDDEKLRKRISENARNIKIEYHPKKIYKKWENYLLDFLEEN